MLLRITQCPRILPVLSQAGARRQLVCISAEGDGIRFTTRGWCPSLPSSAPIRDHHWAGNLHLIVLKAPARSPPGDKLRRRLSVDPFISESEFSITVLSEYQLECPRGISSSRPQE